MNAVKEAAMVDIDMATILEDVATADQAFGEEIAELLQPLRDAIETYAAAEKLNLDDYTRGTHKDAAEAAWQDLGAARKALIGRRDEAETARQAAYAVALGKASPPA